MEAYEGAPKTYKDVVTKVFRGPVLWYHKRWWSSGALRLLPPTTGGNRVIKDSPSSLRRQDIPRTKFKHVHRERRPPPRQVFGWRFQGTSINRTRWLVGTLIVLFGGVLLGVA